MSDRGVGAVAEAVEEGEAGRQGNWCSRLMMAGNGSLRHGCHSRSITYPPARLSRESVHFAYPRASWQQPCYRNPLLPLPSPPVCLSVR